MTDDEAVGFANLVAPLHDRWIGVAVLRHAGRHGLLEKRQRVVAKIEELDVEVRSLFREIEYPGGRLLAESIRARAADNHFDFECAHEADIVAQRRTKCRFADLDIGRERRYSVLLIRATPDGEVRMEAPPG